MVGDADTNVSHIRQAWTTQRMGVDCLMVTGDCVEGGLQKHQTGKPHFLYIYSVPFEQILTSDPSDQM